MKAFSTVLVGVADLDVALKLWVEDFCLEIAERHDGPDESFVNRWDISPEDIARQALVRTPGVELGMLHFVEFVNPGPPVRQGAQAFDLCPKNLDIYVQDMPARIDYLRERGHQFKNADYSEVTSDDGLTFREMHMPVHDEINVVLLEIMGADIPLSPNGFAGVGLLVTTVPDAEAEKAFYRDVVGLDLLHDNLLEGPDIERMIGLPSGTQLDVTIWGDARSDFGRIEVIEYRGVVGKDLYSRAKAPGLGVLGVNLPPISQSAPRQSHSTAGLSLWR